MLIQSTTTNAQFLCSIHSKMNVWTEIAFEIIWVYFVGPITPKSLIQEKSHQLVCHIKNIFFEMLAVLETPSMYASASHVSEAAHMKGLVKCDFGRVYLDCSKCAPMPWSRGCPLFLLHIVLYLLTFIGISVWSLFYISLFMYYILYIIWMYMYLNYVS